jgi:hypothetical protein
LRFVFLIVVALSLLLLTATFADKSSRVSGLTAGMVSGLRNIDANVHIQTGRFRKWLADRDSSAQERISASAHDSPGTPVLTARIMSNLRNIEANIEQTQQEGFGQWLTDRADYSSQQRFAGLFRPASDTATDSRVPATPPFEIGSQALAAVAAAAQSISADPRQRQQAMAADARFITSFLPEQVEKNGRLEAGKGTAVDTAEPAAAKVQDRIRSYVASDAPGVLEPGGPDERELREFWWPPRQDKDQSNPSIIAQATRVEDTDRENDSQAGLAGAEPRYPITAEDLSALTAPDDGDCR